MSETAPNIVKLSRPVTAFGRTITELRFRQPSRADWTGNPLKSDGAGGVCLAVPAALKLAARLTGVPLTTLQLLPSRDAIKVMRTTSRVVGEWADAQRGASR